MIVSSVTMWLLLPGGKNAGNGRKSNSWLSGSQSDTRGSCPCLSPHAQRRLALETRKESKHPAARASLNKHLENTANPSLCRLVITLLPFLLFSA